MESKKVRLSITAPREGARLLVNTNQNIRIRSISPPKKVQIKIKKYFTSGDSSPNNSKKGWQTYYEKVWDWKRLKSAGPSAANFRFRTGENVKRSLPTHPGVLFLNKGRYTVGVRDPAPKGTVAERDDGMASGRSDDGYNPDIEAPPKTLAAGYGGTSL